MGRHQDATGEGGDVELARPSTTTTKQSTTDQSRQPPPDEPNATSTSRKSLSFMLAFAGLSLMLLVFYMDSTCLSIALPAISADLAGTSLEAFWANIGFSLCGLVVQPICASFSHALGSKDPLYVSVALFFAGSVVFATANDMGALVAGRVLQGLGGGGIDVLVTMVLADMTTLQERPMYLGLMSLITAVGLILGPFVGALFSTYAKWRCIGWINLPLLSAGTLLLLFFMEPKARAMPLGGKLGRLDLVGMPLVVAGITAFCVPVSWAGSLFPWASWQTLLPLLVGLGLLIAFVWYESKPVSPIIPYRLFHCMTGNMALVGAFLHGMVLACVLQYLPIFYQAVELRSPIESAVLMLPTIVVGVVSSAGSMMLVPLFGGYVWPMRLSWAIATLGTGLLGLFDVGSSMPMLYGMPILWGQNLAILRLSLLPVQASVKHVDDEGLATANFLIINQFGALVGLAICSPIFSTVFANSMAAFAGDLTGPVAPLRDASNAVKFIRELRWLKVPPSTLHVVLRAYLGAFRAIFYAIAGLGALGLLSSVFLDELPLKREEEEPRESVHSDRLSIRDPV